MPTRTTRRKPGPKPGPKLRTMSMRLTEDSIAWIERHLPRSVSVSKFTREAVEEKIARLRARK